MTEDISDVPRLRAVDIVAGAGKRRVAVQQTYVPPLDGSDDDFEGFDMHLAKGMGELLCKHYYGYHWKTFADSRQGVVGFAIPALMGPTLHMVINLKEYADLTPDLIVDKAGELLERMHLPRGMADYAKVAEAIANRHKFDFGDLRQ